MQILSCALLIATIGQSKQQEFDVPPIDSFNGFAWGGIHLGETTDKQLRTMYKCSKGAFRPTAIVIVQPKSGPMNIQATMNARGDKAIVNGIRIEYATVGPSIGDLTAKLGENSKAYFARERYDNWRLEVFDRTGIAVFVYEPNAGDRQSKFILLCSPRDLDSITMEMQTSPPMISDLRDLRDRLSQPSLVKDATVTIFGNGLDIDNKFNIERGLAQGILNSRSSKYLDFGRGQKGGSCQVMININYTAKDGGNVTARATLTVSTPIGKVVTEASQTEFLEKMGNMPNWSRVRQIDRALDRALKGAINDFDRTIRDAIPSSPEDLHDEAFNEIVNRATLVGK